MWALSVTPAGPFEARARVTVEPSGRGRSLSPLTQLPAFYVPYCVLGAARARGGWEGEGAP